MATDSPYAHIAIPAEDGDDNVPAVPTLQPVSGRERSAAAQPDPNAVPSPDDDLPEILPSDTPDAQD